MIIVQTVNIEVNPITLYDYIIENYGRYFDLSTFRMMELERLLSFYHAKTICLTDFKEIFGLQEVGFFGILKFIVDHQNVEQVAQYGNMCLSDTLAQSDFQKASAGMTL